jgi:HK97 family phage prohead protease
VDHLGKYIADPQGYCNLAHHAALGIYPATHAAEMKAGRSMATRAPYGDVPYGDPGYLDADGNQASKSGKPGVKRYPLSADRVMAAWSYINQAGNAGQYTAEQLKAIKGRVRAAMAKHGHDVMEPASASASRAEFMRMYPLEDIHILRSADGGDGRTVEAYAAVFGEPAEIRDHEGHYIEVIEPSAFSRAIDHAQRARGGFPGSVKVLYNHGMTLNGSPSERFSMPIGVPVDIRAESRGLLTRTRYSETPLADEVLESIRSGAITSQSFTGRIMRSDPQLRRGETYRPRGGGDLITVRRTELGLREYGPVLWPAYSGAEILGVRMSTPGSLDPDDLQEEGHGTPPDEGPAAGDPLGLDEDQHSARYHQHALYALRSRELREKCGLSW